MTITSVRMEPFALRLRQPVRTAAGAVCAREGWWLELRDASGHAGVGEASWLPFFSQGSRAGLEAALRRVTAPDGPLPGAAAGSMEAIGALMASVRPLPSEAGHALEQALVNLLAARKGISAPALLGQARRHVPVHALVRDPADVEMALQAGYRCLKAKVGDLPLAQDLARLTALADAAAGRALLRVDANRAWSEASALQALGAMRGLPLAFVEEPLAQPTPQALARLRRACGVPLAADESARDLESLRALVRAEAVDVVVLKPSLTGGPLTALRMGIEAHEAGLQVVVTHAFDTTVGRQSALLVALCLPVVGACGLVGGYLEGEPADPVAEGAAVRWPDAQVARRARGAT